MIVDKASWICLISPFHRKTPIRNRHFVHSTFILFPTLGIESGIENSAESMCAILLRFNLVKTKTVVTVLVESGATRHTRFHQSQEERCDVDAKK